MDERGIERRESGLGGCEGGRCICTFCTQQEQWLQLSIISQCGGWFRGSGTHPPTKRAAGVGGCNYACGPIGRCLKGGCGMLLVVTRAQQDVGFV